MHAKILYHQGDKDETIVSIPIEAVWRNITYILIRIQNREMIFICYLYSSKYDCAYYINGFYVAHKEHI